MSRRDGALIGGLAIIAVVVWAVLLGQVFRGSTPAAPSGVAQASPAPSSPAASARSAASPRPSTTSARPSAAAASTDPAPTDAPATKPPTGTGDPRLAYAEFLLHLNDARTTAQALNDDLRSTGELGDKAGVRTAVAGIQALIDREGRWLAGHPPAPCYAALHGKTVDLLADYGKVADKALVWADASGFGVLTALSELADAVQTATATATDVGSSIGAVSCG